jgi:hypothetical protein
MMIFTASPFLIVIVTEAPAADALTDRREAEPHLLFSVPPRDPAERCPDALKFEWVVMGECEPTRPVCVCSILQGATSGAAQLGQLLRGYLREEQKGQAPGQRQWYGRKPTSRAGPTARAVNQDFQRWNNTVP